ncbi:transcriptional regulator [Litoribrevibacter albus]|uniref:Transcriptional regulator n=1 Tax=Litoribrevibacter albus TaxID=1473156 RepID=A0AA37W9B8_9GAMM|nr:transcriptional regulator [Litoribrevibacter albus]
MSAAARHLDLSPAVTSAAVKRLESELGAPLFIRSTRHLRLTHQGEVFLDHCQKALQLIDDGYQSVRAGETVIQDVLQVSMPSDIGRRHLLSWLDEFQQMHPKVELRVQLSDRLVNIYQQPIDIAFRYGPPPDSRLIALPLLAENRRVLCASPEYLNQQGLPESPESLKDHNCLCFMLGDEVHNRWHFSLAGQPITVKVRGNRVADDGDAVRRWALSGQGVAYKSRLDVVEDLRAGRLIELCPEWQTEAAPFHLMCGDRRLLTPAVQALKAFVAEKCVALYH